MITFPFALLRRVLPFDHKEGDLRADSAEGQGTANGLVNDRAVLCSKIPAASRAAAIEVLLENRDGQRSLTVKKSR